MSIRWQQFLHHAFFWLIAEIILNSIGIDTLADYSEFVFAQHPITNISQSY